MIQSAQVTVNEKEVLLFWKRKGGCGLLRDRAHAVLLGSEGMTSNDIANVLFCNERSVRNWLAGFRRKRISSILTKYQGNSNASKLSPAQKDHVKKILSSPPSKYGIPKDFWTVKDLKKYIKVEFGVIYESDRSYHFLLKLSGFSWKLPDKFDIRRDDQLVATRLKEIRQEIKPLLNSPDWVVLATDETRLVWETQSRRAWLKRNQKTIIRVNRKRECQSFLGCLNLNSYKTHLYSLSWQNQEETIKALKKLKKYYLNKKICLIWDNAKWHHGKLIREELRKGNSLENFHLINFAPYAPDTNPVEHIWKYVKDKISNHQDSDFKQTVNRFKLVTIHRKFKYQI